MSKPIEAEKPVFCVDTHFHVFRAGESRPGARYVPGYSAPLTAWQAAAQPLGVTHGVLVQTSFMGTDNRLLVETLVKNPDSLRGVAVLSPNAQSEELVSLHEAGVRGIRLNLSGTSHDMSAWANARSLWDAVLKLGWHVEMHTDSGLFPDICHTLPQAIPLVLDHFGRPRRASRHDATVKAVCARRQAPVLIKLSAVYRVLSDLKPNDLASLWLGELGPDALLWGSDWPCTNHESQADFPRLYGALDQWLGGDASLTAAIRSANPMRLYWA